MARITILLIISIVFVFESCTPVECRKVTSSFDNGNEEVVQIYPNCNDTSTYKRQYYFENGQLGSEGSIMNSLHDGVFRSWTSEGVLTAKWGFKKGKEDGPVNCWFDSGEKKREAFQKEGLLHGPMIDWDKNGKVQTTGYYANCQRDSTWIYYKKNDGLILRRYKNDTLEGKTYERNTYSNGITDIVLGQFKNGEETGLWKWFTKDSILTTIGFYNEGKREGLFTSYYKNEKIKYENVYKNDSLFLRKSAYNIKGEITLSEGIGEVHGYYGDGKLEQTSNFLNNKRLNTTKYFKNGGIRSIDNYEVDSIKRHQIEYDMKGNIILKNGTGKHIVYSDEEEIEYEAELVNSERTGIAIWYYKNGQIEKSARYENSLRMEVLSSFDKTGKKRNPGTLKDGNGTWIDYDDSGQITKTDTYKNGVLVTPQKIEE